MNITRSLKNLNGLEWGLWIFSLVVIVGASLFSGSGSKLMTINSLIGVTALIFTSKGDVIGQFLIVVFSIMYGIISYSFSYYGEMITYLFMTMPIAIMSVISWIRHPFGEDKPEVKVNKIHKREVYLMFVLTALVTAVFYFVLKAFDTANLGISTVSIATSFMASYLTFRRSEFYALAYSANDIVLIIMWALAAKTDISYISVMICFVIFLINDLYGYINWKNIKNRQNKSKMVQS